MKLEPPVGESLADLDHLQLRVVHPRRGIDIAHEGRYARARLSDALHLELLAGFLDLREVDALGNGLHELVEQMHDLGPFALQLLDDFHARDQALLAILEILNVGDLRVELDDLLFQKIVLRVLRIDPAGIQKLAAQDEDDRRKCGAAQGDHEFAASDFTFLFAPGK